MAHPRGWERREAGALRASVLAEDLPTLVAVARAWPSGAAE